MIAPGVAAMPVRVLALPRARDRGGNVGAAP